MQIDIDVDNLNKNELLNLYCDAIESKIEFDSDVQNKVKKYLEKNIFHDFPLILDSKKLYSYKNKELIKDSLFDKLDKCSKDLIFYTNKVMDSESKGRFPLSIADKEEKYIHSAYLNKEEICDFSGNAANSQYYKVISILYANNGVFLKKDYSKNSLPLFIRQRIDWFEEWYKSFKVEENIFLDSITPQICYPLNDSYISITPVHSVGFIKKVINTNSNLKKIFFDEIVPINKKIENTKKKLNSRKKKSNEEIQVLKDEISKLKLEKNNLFNPNIIKWQDYQSKLQNTSLQASGAKDGIFVSDAPSYNRQIAKDIYLEFLADREDSSFEQNISSYFYSKTKYLYAKQEEFSKLVKTFKSYAKKHLLSDIDTNSTEKKIQIRYCKNAFLYFKQTLKKEIDFLDLFEQVDFFIDSILKIQNENDKEKDITLSGKSKYKLASFMIKEIEND